jgi:serine/threonine protein kinase
LVQKLLIADPDKRMTPTEALAHPWFSEPQEKLAGRVIERKGEFKIRDENEINSKAAGNLLVM